MSIEHRTTPIEHWIVDGKAYRLATEQDVGKRVARATESLEECLYYASHNILATLDKVHDKVPKFDTGSRWTFALIQDDSLLKDDAEIEPVPTEEPSAKPIDWTKPVRTKDGRAVRVLCTDGPGEYPVVGLVDGMDEPRTWTIYGQYFTDGPDQEDDLENVPSRIQIDLWVNVYPNGNFYTYRTRESADAYVGGRFACVKITIDCEEGEGL